MSGGWNTAKISEINRMVETEMLKGNAFFSNFYLPVCLKQGYMLALEITKTQHKP